MRVAIAVLALIAGIGAGCSRRDDRQAGPPVVAPQLPPAAVNPSVRPGNRVRVQAVFDSTMGMLAYRLLVPEDWKAGGRTDWNYSDLYLPLRIHTRAEAPDGSAWYEAYPTEEFFYGDHELYRQPPVVFGAIHYRQIDLATAMTRYIIPRYRGRAANLRILGYRPVRGLGQALGVPDVQGEGICFRIQYNIGDETADEEFYASLGPVVPYSFSGPQGTWYEYHRRLELVHSFGAKHGRLEDLRPVLGSIAPSVRTEKAWQQRIREVFLAINREYSRQLQITGDKIRAAGEMSRLISANNDRLIRNMDAQRAAGAQAAARLPASGQTAAFDRGSDAFQQYMRDTEHVVDQYGQVSDQSNLYNYHWTDGFDNWVHSNDPSFNPNDHSNQPYERARPVR